MAQAKAFDIGKSIELFKEAKKYFAGGVGSPRRAKIPIYIDHGKGSRLWDVNGNEYIDYLLAFGPLLLGHAHPSIIEAVREQLELGTMYACSHPLEVEVSRRLVEIVPGLDKVRFANTGSESCQIIMRLARAYTGKDKIIKFEGHYHGWYDGELISVHPPLDAAGPESSPWNVRASHGIPYNATRDIISIPWNDIEALTRTIEAHKHETAAVIMEPFMCNSGGIPPKEGYLKAVRDLTRENGILLLFDEIVTGFRFALGGAQEYYGVIPDLTALSKGMAGGMPIAAYGGRDDIMELIARGEVYQAGTYNSNPLCLAAVLATLNELSKDEGKIYKKFHALGNRMMEGMRTSIQATGVQAIVLGVGPVFQLHFTRLPTFNNYRDVCSQNVAKADTFREELFKRGVLVNPSYWGVWYVSASHTEEDIDHTLNIIEDALLAVA